MPSRELGRKSLVLFSSGWVTSALGMVISVAIARRLGPDAVGSIGFSLGLAGLFMAVMLPGFGQAHHKRLAEGQDPGRCIGTMTAIQLTLTIAFVAVLGLSWSWTGRGFDSPLDRVFVFMLSAQIASSFSDIVLRVFVAREWIVAYGAILLGGRLLRAVVTAGVLVLAPDVVWVAAAFTLEGVINGVVATGVLLARGITMRTPTRDSIRSYWDHARPLLVTTPLALFQDSVDRFVVGRWAGLTAAGYYHIARALGEVIGTLLAAPTMLLFTRLSALYARRTTAGDTKARVLFSSALDKVLFVIVPTAFLIWAFAELIVTALYGSRFAAAATAVRLLVLASVVEALVSPYTFAIYALGAGARLVPVNIVRVLVYVGALWALVHPDGLIPFLTGLRPGDPGAAISRLILIAFPAWLYWKWTQELAGIGLLHTYRVYGLGFGVMVVAHATATSLFGHVAGPGAATAAAAMVSFTAYAVVLFSLHPNAQANLKDVGTLLSPSRLLAFVTSRRDLR